MQARTFGPSSALSFAEAAVLAGVEPERIAALADSGELLYEGSRDRSRDERVVRLVELADLFPHVLGRRVPAGLDDSDGAPEGDLSLREVDVPRPDLAEEVLASGASRDALVELAQDLEARLDLAERERQASTASLLMAQRRVLDLELRLRRRPWFLAGTTAAMVLSCAALLVLVRLPGMIEATTKEELGVARLQTEAELLAFRHASEAALEEAASERAAAERRAAEAIASAVASADAIAREARDARLAAEERAATLAARADGQRAELESALEGLEARLRAADERDRRLAAELEVARDGASRARVRFEQRLEEAGRAADAARDALEEERRLGATERDRHAARIAAMLDRIAEASLRLEELEASRVEVQEPADAAAPGAPSREESPRGPLMRFLTRLLRPRP